MSGEVDGAAELRTSAAGAIPAQTVTLEGSDEHTSYAIYGRDVEINTSIGVVDKSSSKVKMADIASYDWIVRRYAGQLVATDRMHKYIAYPLLKQDAGVVRLIHRELNDRILIKGYKGMVLDLAFAHSDIDVLASLDDRSTLFVHRIDLDPASHLIATNLIQVNWQTSCPDVRVIWCSYLPDETNEEEEEDDKTMQLATLIDSKVYVLNVTQLANEHGIGPHQYNEVSGSVVEINKHVGKVVAATFSPDGTNIATAGEDGRVCFFGFDVNNPVTPRCLFDWKPHDGRPMSMLAFLDNHIDPSPNCKFWKYLMTGADENTEIKVWTCETWTCLQTVRFKSDEARKDPCLIANIDPRSKFLILSDVNSCVLYVLDIHQDINGVAAHISSINEFPIAQQCLSFIILDIRKKPVFNGDDSDDDDEEESEDSEESDSDDEAHSNGLGKESRRKRDVQIHIIGVRPKVVSDMFITFAPLSSTVTDSLQTEIATSAVSAGSRALPDALSDLSVSQSLTSPISDEVSCSASAPAKDRGDSHTALHLSLNEDSLRFSTSAPPPLPTSTTPVLLTPEAFTSSSPKMQAQLESLVTPGSGRSMKSPGSGRSSLTHVTHIADNSSMVIGGSAFDAGTASSVSSMTLTSRSNAGGGQGDASPSSVPLPDSVPSSRDAPDMVRQLDELFGSMSSSETGEVNPPLSGITALTEEDILAQMEATRPKPDIASAEADAPKASLNTSGASAYDTKIWPRPPDPPLEEPGQETGDTDEGDTTEDSSAETSSEKESIDEELNVKEIERDVEQQEAEAVRRAEPRVDSLPRAHSDQLSMSHSLMQEKFTTHLEDVKASILTLNEMMMSQGRDIHVLKSSEGSNQKVDKLSKQVHTLSTTMSAKLEHTVNALKREQKAVQEKLVSQTTSKLSHELRTLVEKSVSSEIKKSVIPMLQQMIEPVKRDLHNVMAEKLTAADVTFKESITKLVNSQATVDSIGQSVGLVVQDVMLGAHRDSLSQQILPSFDSSIRQAFSQINTGFSDGLNNYMKQLKDSVDKVNTKQMNTHAIVMASCESALESLKQTSVEVQNHITASVKREVHQQVSLALSSMKTALISDIQEAVRAEISSSIDSQRTMFSDQLEALRSTAATPAPETPSNSATIKVQIERSLSMNDYDRAFQGALSASDLSVVIYLLEKLPDSAAVLSEPCPLSQPTLLSLMQQLSCGLSAGKNLDLIFDYLADAVINLDPHDSVTMQHMGVVVGGTVREKLSEFITKNPNSAHKRTVGAIEKSIKSLLKYVKA